MTPREESLSEQDARWAMKKKTGWLDYIITHTPWKINMDHNDGGLEDHFPFQMGDLLVPC